MNGKILKYVIKWTTMQGVECKSDAFTPIEASTFAEMKRSAQWDVCVAIYRIEDRKGNQTEVLHKKIK